VPAVEADGPLVDDELDALFAPLADASLIALAVSGGSDSLALTDCVTRWRRRRGGVPQALVLTVDHRLRRGSRREAANVVAIARERGMMARVLAWTGPPPQSNVEAAARAVRYRLLLKAAGEAGASHLLLAHHRDDVAETFVMRLKRGAGVFGLAAMRPVVSVGGLTILRPFLDVPRRRLVATTAAASLAPVEDAMNADPRFLRARVRRMLPRIAEAGLDPSLFADAARRLAAAADAIDAAASALIDEAVETDAFAVAWVDFRRLTAAPDEVRLRVLVRVLIAIGGEDYPPERERLDRLALAMAAHRNGRFKRTLAGAVVEWRAGRFVFYREMGRGGLPTMALKVGFDGVWDHRFQVAVGKDAPGGLTIGPLGEDGRRLVGAYAGNLPAGALAAVPAIRRRQKLLAVPALDYVAGGGEALPVTLSPAVAVRLRRPPLFPDFAVGP